MEKGKRRPAPSATEKQQVTRLQRLLEFAEGRLGVEQFEALVRSVVPQFEMSIPEQDRMTAEKYDDLRAWLKAGLERIADGAEFSIPAQRLRLVITKGRFEYKGNDPIALLKQAVAAILSTQHWRVSRCGRFRCRKLYVAINGSLFCTTTCGGAERMWKRRHRLSTDAAPTAVPSSQVLTPEQAQRRLSETLAQPRKRWTDPD